MTRPSTQTRVGPRGERRDETVTFRLTPTEKALIERAAVEEGFRTVSSYVQSIVVGAILGVPR
jgi:uncharacterized protein (DUF1778 family)